MPYQNQPPQGGGGPGWAPPPPPVPPRPYGGQWPPPRPQQRKSGSAGLTVLGIMLGGLAAVAILLVVGAAMLGNDTKTETTTPVAIPSYQPQPKRTKTVDPVRPTRRPTQQPTRQPTAEPTQRGDETDETEQTVEQPTQVRVDTSLKTNSVYRGTALPRLNCSAGNTSIYNHAQLKRLILKTGECMDRAWGPVLNKAGIQWSPPGYAIASGRGRGACGDYPSAGSMVPYYCPRNNTIYASTGAMANGNGNARGYGEIISWHGGIISMMAHEYGHHVQNLTGILNTYWGRHQETSNRNSQLAMSRRLELQATCFGGMWMRSVATSYPVPSGRRAELFRFYGIVGDYPGWPRDHGSPANNNRWFRQGWERNTPAQCNTWSASSSSTS
ncbi:neutral zinc metallopeptidase [Nonomuraea soli]|uniref:Peptidase n=1 Tax=Nonomuraea soli TaxID=1032476 RepID=A0A7W0CGC3_9ACTN|nr:neutral zinc metallopeptidase [Nonomuraea soli]MBA2890661.1 hypothetical protein [Nonomuraea soli]